MSGVRLEDVTKQFGKHDPVVRSVSLDIEDGEFVVLVGPSGCGKSTLLRMVAGLEEIGEGRILIGDEDAAGMAPRDRDVAMVFQSYALYPQMTVRANLGFGLRVRKVDKARIRERIEAIARVLGLDELLDRKPAQLSGGQRQRVAIGRAMVREPKVFLMDEPLSNLDAKLRVAMRAELARLHAQLGVTTIYVTHDQVEAMTLGQRVAVLHAGRLQQVDTPHALFDQPANLFVASFIGSPTMNLVHAQVRDGDVRFADYALPLPALTADGPVALGIRPTDFMDARDAPPELPRLTVAVEVVEELGTETYVVFGVDAEQVTLDGASATGPDEERLLVADERTRFTARVDSRRSVGVGDHLELAVDNMRLHLFDPASGKRVAAREGA